MVNFIKILFKDNYFDFEDSLHMKLETVRFKKYRASFLFLLMNSLKRRFLFKHLLAIKFLYFNSKKILIIN